MKIKQFVINTILIALLTLEVISCKKSKLSPNCWGEKHKAIIFPYCTQEKVLYLKLVEEDYSSYWIYRNEVPKELKPAIGDSVSVWVKFRKKKDCGCQAKVCHACCKKIKCIQKR